MVWSTRKKIFIIHGKGRVGGEGEEAGGDLDTIVSNTFYGCWCRGMVQKELKREAQYGQDFEFDFVNYHEGLAHLSIHPGCDVYLPDFPLDAIPDLKNDVIYLKKTDVSLIRIDDHHPWSDEAIAILDELKNQELLEDYVLKGPKKGVEMPKHQQVCGADLIYRTFIKNSEFDNPGLAELRRLAHVQDLHLEMDPLALQLSKLIGSGHSKIDMVLRLMEIKTFDDLKNIMSTTTWDREVRAYEKALRRVVSKLNNNLVLVEFYKPPDNGVSMSNEDLVAAMTKHLGFFSFLLPLTRFLKNQKLKERFIKWLYSLKRSNMIRILMALAPYRPPGEVKINVASAIEFLRTQVTMNYFFYCYGSFLMTTRNISDLDGFIDLSLLMPFVGSDGDGGHKEAASCKPAENLQFDKEKFERVGAANFLEYCKYIAFRVSEFSGLPLKKVSKIGS
ncbi:hypothetical protein ACFL27_08080 [candidate division CSSED10-310 bacterium]|uniref:Uncharacterized protein n=1 Tax=candidate division CSSED10-310 bacterium TaxID=2855610 RepID=A0ABV6YVA8_UNCC1